MTQHGVMNGSTFRVRFANGQTPAFDEQPRGQARATADV
jgi:hypothetical protein